MPNGLRQPLNNFQVGKTQQSQNFSELSFQYQKNSAETTEQRHQRNMMMRASQVTSGSSAMIKSITLIIFIFLAIFDILANNEIEFENGKNSSIGMLKDNQSLKQILPSLAKKRTYNESDAKLKVSATGSAGNLLSAFPNQQALVKKFRPIVPRQSSGAQNGI